MRANCKMALKASMGDVGGAVACMTKVDQLLQMNQNADPVLYLITGRVCFCFSFSFLYSTKMSWIVTVVQIYS